MRALTSTNLLVGDQLFEAAGSSSPSLHGAIRSAYFLVRRPQLRTTTNVMIAASNDATRRRS
jgi:hypothetical protein